jgi:alpha-tubulin suppressor-like RCC1 family protein
LIEFIIRILNLNKLKSMRELFIHLLLILSFQISAQCWQSINGGYGHSVGIRTDGTLWAWGDNSSGQLGDGTFFNKDIPTQIGISSNWQVTALGKDHSLAIKTDGTLWSWGNNSSGQLGDGTNFYKYSPTQIGSANNWKTATGGGFHSLGIKTDGTLWAWGYNFYGELGDGTFASKNIPTQIGVGNDWKSIAAGAVHSLGIKTDGTLWTWGFNQYGELGDGTNIDKNTPIQIGTANNWQSIAAGDYYSMGIKTDGTLWTWGRNLSGQLGIGTQGTVSINIPTQVGIDNNWKSVDGSDDHSLGIKTDGTLWAWGMNGAGELGNGTVGPATVNVPNQIGLETNWQSIATSLGEFSGHSLGIKNDGTLWAWGWNFFGQLGNGTTNNYNIPNKVNCISNGINDLKNEKNFFSTYPNPSSKIVYINNRSSKSIDNLLIIDALGRKVLEQKENCTQINIQPYEKGIYELIIFSDGKVYTNKILKE